MVLKNHIKLTTVQISKNAFGAVVSTNKFELTTVPNSKIEYRAVISKNTSEIIQKITFYEHNVFVQLKLTHFI